MSQQHIKKQLEIKEQPGLKGQGLSEAAFKRAYALLEEKEAIKAFPHLEEAVKGHPPAYIWLYQLFRLYKFDHKGAPIGKTRALCLEGKIRSALEWYRKNAHEGEGNWQSAFALGYLYTNGIVVKKNLTEAMYWYELAFALNNKCIFVLEYLSSLYVKQNLNDEARKVAQTALDMGFETASIYYNLGKACLSLNKKHDALEAFSAALKLDSQGLDMVNDDMANDFADLTGLDYRIFPGRKEYICSFFRNMGIFEKDCEKPEVKQESKQEIRKSYSENALVSDIITDYLDPFEERTKGCCVIL